MVLLTLLAVDPQRTRLTARGMVVVLLPYPSKAYRVEHTTRAQTGGVPVCGIPLGGNVRTVEV